MITLIAEIMLAYTLRNWSSLKTKSKWHLLRITWVNTESPTGSSSSFRNYDIAGIFLFKNKKTYPNLSDNLKCCGENHENQK